MRLSGSTTEPPLGLSCCLSTGRNTWKLQGTQSEEHLQTPPSLTGHLQQLTRVGNTRSQGGKASPSATAGHSAPKSQEHQGPADPDPARGMGMISRSATGGGDQYHDGLLFARSCRQEFFNRFSITHWNSHTRKSEPPSWASSTTNPSDQTTQSPLTVPLQSSPCHPHCCHHGHRSGLAASSLPGAH